MYRTPSRTEPVIDINRPGHASIQTTAEIQALAGQQLKTIADLLLNALFSPCQTGMNGKTGILIFLFHYSAFSKQDIYRRLAEKSLNSILESGIDDIPICYADGLAGAGCAMLYLARKRFIELPLAYLQDIDHALYNKSWQGNMKFLNSLTGITGTGKYYIDRQAYVFPSDPAPGEYCNKAIYAITSQLYPPYASYSEIIHAIHILGEIYAFTKEDCMAKDYLDYSLDKLETMKYEDLHFCNAYQVFDHLLFALSLISVSEKSGDPKYRRVGMEYLEGDGCFTKYRHAGKNAFRELPAQRWLLYHRLAHKIDNLALQRDMAGLLEDIPVASLRQDAVSAQELENFGLFNGYAGLGMHLLTATGVIDREWFDLIPAVY